jgi:hypothetical protein
MTYEVVKTVKMSNGTTWSAMANRFESRAEAEQYADWAATMMGRNTDTTFTVRES